MSMGSDILLTRSFLVWDGWTMMSHKTQEGSAAAAAAATTVTWSTSSPCCTLVLRRRSLSLLILSAAAAHTTRAARFPSLAHFFLCVVVALGPSDDGRFSPELVGSLKLGNVLVFVQLIFGCRWPMNQLNKKSNIA